MAAKKTNVPLKGPVRNTSVVVNDTVYGMKSGLYHEWLKGKVIDVYQKNNEVRLFFSRIHR